MLLELDGQIFDRARVLAREAAAAAIHGGPSGEGALEFVLTEAAGDRLLSTFVCLILANLSGAVVRTLATEGSTGDITQAAEQLLDELMGQISIDAELSGTEKS
ncbi:MAG TPA: hypothetical protein VG435_14290 [Acidimicrobiales bacterium]|nr:hypothetical protein [Acidimicrobiales bacterium]